MSTTCEAKYLVCSDLKCSKPKDGCYDAYLKSISDIKDMSVGYEILIGEVVPYYDYETFLDSKGDKIHTSRNDQKSNWRHELEKCYQALVDRWGPSAKIYAFDSSGQHKTKECYGNSFHFIVRGVGKYPCGEQMKNEIQNMDIEFDNTVYKNASQMQKFRVFGTSKKDENRIKKRVIRNAEGDWSIIEPDDDTTDVAEYLIQNVADETLIEYIPNNDIKIQPPKVKAKHVAKDEDSDIHASDMLQMMEECKDDMKKYDYVNADYIVKLLEMLSDERADNRDHWLKVVWALKNTADLYDIDLLEEARTFSMRSDKHNDDMFEALYDASEKKRDRKLSLAIVRVFAKQDNLDLYTSYHNQLFKQKKITNNALLDLDENEYLEHFEKKALDVKTFSDRSRLVSDIITWMNSFYCLINDSDAYVIQKCYDMVDGKMQHFHERKEVSSLQKKYWNSKNILLPNFAEVEEWKNKYGKRSQPVIECFKEWFNSKHRHIKQRLDFDPVAYYENLQCENDGKKLMHTQTYNTYSGLAFEPNDDDVSLDETHPFFVHLLQNWCKSNELYYNNVLDWIAYSLQNPGKKINYAIVLKSLQGGGKGIIVSKVLAKILGSKNFFQTTNIDHALGKFNGLLADKLLVFLDEVNWPGNKNGENDILKALITESKLTINKKNVKEYEAKNCFNMIIASNNKRIIDATSDARRFFVLELGNGLKEMKDADRIKFEKDIVDIDKQQLLNWFFRRDVSGFNPKGSPMVTEGLRNQRLESQSPLQNWWSDILNSGKLDMIDLSDQERHWVIRDRLYLDYQSRNSGYKYDSVLKFMKEFKVYIPGCTQQQKMRFGVRNQELWMLPLNELRRIWIEDIMKDPEFKFDDTEVVEEDDTDLVNRLV